MTKNYDKIRADNLAHAGKMGDIAKQIQTEVGKGNNALIGFWKYIAEWESCTKEEQEDWAINGRKK